MEYLVLQGSADLQGYGNSPSNAIVGNTGNNLLNGEAGADAMYGGAGNDVYFVDDAGDVVIENANEGNDTVYASIDYGLTANVDNLILQGSANLQAYGNNGVNALFGNSGNNILNGEGGADHMFGGAGNDVYCRRQCRRPGGRDRQRGHRHGLRLGRLHADGECGQPDPARGQATCRPPATARSMRSSATPATIRSMAEPVPTSSSGGAGNDTFVFNVGQANGDTIIDFAGNGAGAGDTLSFVGFGTAAQGATFTQIGVSNQWTIHSGLGGPDEIITLSNGASVDPNDFLFS